MDPTANVREMRALATAINVAVDLGQKVSDIDADRLAELVLALDRWITSGGHLPHQWRGSYSTIPRP